MSSITAQVTAGQVVRVTVVLDAGVTGSMRVWRVLPDGSRGKVMGTGGLARSGSWDDPEAPVGQPVRYEAIITGGSTGQEQLGGELLANPGFDDGMTSWQPAPGWFASPGTPTIPVHSGAGMVQSTTAGATLTQTVPVSGGVTLVVSAWSQSPPAGPGTVTVQPDVGAPLVIDLPTGAPLSWAQATGRLTLDAAATSAQVTITSTGADWTRVDDVSVRPVQIVTQPSIGPTDPVTIAADHPLISDPYRGIVCPVTVLADGQDRTMAGRDTAVDIIGRRSRIHVWDVEAAPTFSPQFITEPADHATFEELMTPGDPLLLRFPCTQHPDLWMQRGGDRTWSWLTRRCQARKHTLSSCEELEGPPSDEPVWTDTLGDLHAVAGGDGVGTLGAIAERWETLGAIAATDLKALL